MKQSKYIICLGGLTLIFWWTSLGGQDFFTLPALLLVGYLGYLIYLGQFNDKLIPLGQQWGRWVITAEGERWWKRIFIVHGLLFFVTVVLKYYSFNLNTWDAGIHSNILFNISQGDFYSSFLNTHNLADHFTPSMSFISLFYMITPSIHWMMGFKVLAYVMCPFLFYWIAQTIFDNPKHAKVTGAVLGIAWLLFYAPGIHSVNYEFQASSLAPAAILYAFLTLRKDQWFRFGITMLFILGLKEHLGSVWIGMGCYLLLATSRKKLGVFLIGAGIIALYLIMFQAMPYFRSYLSSWSMQVAPFNFVSQKFVYFFQLLIPFMFLPLIFWRYGILAAPAIGVNLISGRETMVSSSFHYDDVSSVLLFLAMLFIIQQVPWKSLYLTWGNQKLVQCGLLVWGICFLSLWPAGPGKYFMKSIPEVRHWEILKEIDQFDTFSQGEAIAVQTSLGPHFYRKTIRDLVHHEGGDCSVQNAIAQSNYPVKYIVLAPELNHYMIDDMQQCLTALEKSSSYRRVPMFDHIYVFENLGYIQLSSLKFRARYGD